MEPCVVKVFANESWIHLGDEPNQPKSLMEKLKGRSLSSLPRLAMAKFHKNLNNMRAGADLQNAYGLTDFRTLKYSTGDLLPFEDESFDFIYSDHLFEHLFLDEAVALFTECKRVMRPGAVIRTCVPDAELKTHEKPEFAGFPDPKMSFTDPAKHKTRWTVYSLSEILRLVGFITTPLIYYTKTGEFIEQAPSPSCYPDNPDMECTTRMDYVARRMSLIVDGQKRVDSAGQ